MTTDNAALVFNLAAALASANAENSRVLAGRSRVGRPKYTPFMPDNCPILACPEAIFDRQPLDFAPRGSIAINSPVGAFEMAEAQRRERFDSPMLRVEKAPRQVFPANSQRILPSPSRPPAESRYQSRFFALAPKLSRA